MNLQDRIKKNEGYFKSIEIHNGYLTMIVNFKPKWGVFPSPDEKIKVGNSPSGNKNEWVYYGKYDEVTVDDIFDLVEQTIDVNLEAALKIELMSEKIEELKKLFSETPYSKLQTLTFNISDTNNSKTKNKSKKANKRSKIEENDVNDVIIASKEEPLKSEINAIQNDEIVKIEVLG
jgi:hypothetical protein